jgi:hypothetical protein
MKIFIASPTVKPARHLECCKSFVRLEIEQKSLLTFGFEALFRDVKNGCAGKETRRSGAVEKIVDRYVKAGSTPATDRKTV